MILSRRFLAATTRHLRTNLVMMQPFHLSLILLMLVMVIISMIIFIIMMLFFFMENCTTWNVIISKGRITI